ncbi:sodium-dependent glucose transporter 1A-like [Mizuhopecten yessoensis]|uniref:sodium-dependent glucose transporter 1A-like n=1 Tax=Mizuhopecten yessoensis TaxID=6573 RepID=UPI000B45F507|nr:sodium-dependent glucose transporter 1A-like [Mizuhopecten yessoensis]XP_021362963.1 sodium-dependent glucose transporter 1A-like [Mizuhopecten yessoensis]XP_021362964.1 sodium-dependent glucose transporter 1A-like [Mizuhopecten yessoensis]
MAELKTITPPGNLPARNKVSQSDERIAAENEKDENGEEATCSKVMRTMALVCVWIAMGIYMEINGPTLKDLVLRTGSSYEDITSALSGRSVGKFVGVVIGGLLTDRFGRYCDLFLALSLTVAATAVAIVPWINQTEVLWVFYFLLGITIGTIDIAGQRIVLVSWKEKAASPIHIVHLGYGVGGFIAPLIANPFLANTETVGPNITNSSVSNISVMLMSTISIPTTTTTVIISPSTIEYAYGSVAGLTIVMAGVLYMYQCKTSPRFKHKKGKTENSEQKLTRTRKWREMLNPASCAEGSFCFGSLILVTLFLKYFVYLAVDRVFSTFIRSYSIDQLHFSNDDASYLNTLYWIFYAVGRFVGFVSARWISVKILLVIESVCLVGVSVGLFTVGTYSQTALWVLTGMSGFFIGPIFPSGIAWGDLHIELTGLAITWVLLGSSFGGLAFLKLGGHAYDHFGGIAFVYMIMILAIVVFCVDIMLTILSMAKKRITRKTYSVEPHDKQLQS